MHDGMFGGPDYELLNLIKKLNISVPVIYAGGIRNIQDVREILTKKVPPTQKIRLGGLVKNESIKKSKNNEITFLVTDNKSTIAVKFYGILPDLFREGQGIVAEGKLKSGTFFAEEVLAKHDENYMPPEVAAALKQSGQWQGELK